MSDRRRRISLQRQLKLVTPLLLVWGVACVVLLIAGFQTRVPLRDLLLDPTAIGEVPWYTGLLSNMGILAWTIAVTSAIGGAWVAFQTARPSAARFLVVGGSVTAVLLFDDLLLLHSSALPKIIGASKPVSLLLVTAPAVMWVAVFLGEIARTRWMILTSAFGSFFVSVVADQVLQPTGSTALLLEDGAKLLGVLAWSLYFVLTTRDITRSTIQAATAQHAESSGSEAHDDKTLTSVLRSRQLTRSDTRVSRVEVR